MLRFVICLLATLGHGSVCGAANTDPLPHERINHLMEALLGAWDGEAVETPVGPVNYDIEFRRCSDGAHVGVAETGASLHYWRFFETRREIHIRFMSTFAGNRESTLLLLRGVEGESIRFFAPDREILTLLISPTKDNIDIRVFHWDKPHVHIVLKRPAPRSEPLRTRRRPCDKLPASLLER